MAQTSRRFQMSDSFDISPLYGEWIVALFQRGTAFALLAFDMLSKMGPTLKGKELSNPDSILLNSLLARYPSDKIPVGPIMA